MLRLITTSCLAVAFCTLQSGCCCCRLPFAIRGGGPIVFNPPPIVVNQPPPDNNPVQDQNPFNKDNLFNKDKFVIPGAKTYVYSQSTGQFKLDNDVIGIGYSGKGAGRNNPAMQTQKNLGPIPAGDHKIMGKRVDPKTGEPVFDTLPSFQNARLLPRASLTRSVVRQTRPAWGLPATSCCPARRSTRSTTTGSRPFESSSSLPGGSPL